MSFGETVQPATSGRPRIVDRVAASHAHGSLIRFMLSADVAGRLGAATQGRLDLRVGFGTDHGKVILRACNDNGVFTFAQGTQIAFNVRGEFLAKSPPDELIVLSHEWRDDDLIVDISQLEKASS